MGGACQHEVAGGGEVTQQQELRHRIGATRQRGHHPGPAGPEPMAGDVPPHAVQERGGQKVVPVARLAGAGERRLVPEGGLEPPTLRL